MQLFLNTETGEIQCKEVVNLAPDCNYIRNLYKQENRPQYHYDLLVSSDVNLSELGTEIDLLFKFDLEAVKKEIGIDFILLQAEFELDEKQYKEFKKVINDENFIHLALKYGLRLETQTETNLIEGQIESIKQKFEQFKKRSKKVKRNGKN